MNHFVENLEQHPVIGLILSVCSAMLGLLLETLGGITSGHIPPLIIESLQALSYLGGITVASITIHGWIKKNKK